MDADFLAAFFGVKTTVEDRGVGAKVKPGRETVRAGRVVRGSEVFDKVLERTRLHPISARQVRTIEDRGRGRGERYLWVNEAEETAAVGGIYGDEDLICSSRTRNGYPIRAKSCAN